MDKVVSSLIDTMNAQLPLMYLYMSGVQVTEETDWLGMQSSHDVFYNAVYDAHFSPDNVEKRVDEVVLIWEGLKIQRMTAARIKSYKYQT
ncbi:MAG: hypothetical protein HYU84_05860 [Chloroflexi bacterium]|nr:hypothetical protein [Chloroflexota bacterium]